MSTAAVGLASPALGMSSGPASAQDTLKSLQARGFKVCVNNLCDKPLDQTQVVRVRQAHAVPGRGGDITHEHITKKVLYIIVYVDVKQRPLTNSVPHQGIPTLWTPVWGTMD